MISAAKSNPAPFLRKVLRFAGVAAVALAGVMVLAPPDAGAASALVGKLSPRAYKMPKGDHVVGPFRARKQTPRRIPIGDAALAAIKANPTAAAADMTTLAPSGGPNIRSWGGTCTTNSAVGFAPSDIHGAVSATRLVVVTNVEVGVYRLTDCALISKVSLSAFFGNLGNEILFDPRVIFDRISGRFFVTAESEETSGTDQRQFWGVSSSYTPTAWTTYSLKLSESQTATLNCKSAQNSFWDFPQVGVSTNRLYTTANDFLATGGVVGAIIWLDKAPMLTASSTSARCATNLPFNLAPPMVMDASTNAVFLSPGSGGGSTIARLDLASPTTIGSDTLIARPSFAIPAWTAAPDPAQPNGQTLDAIDGRFQSYSTQSRGLLWNIHTVGVGSPAAAKIRWYRLNATSTASSTVLNLATFQTASTDRLFNPSIVTASGLPGAPIYINTTRTIPSITTGAGNAAMVMMWGLNNDSSAANWRAQAVQTSTTQFTGCGGPCRWGDYSSVETDPANNGTAWGFNQIVTGTSQFNWGTSAVKTYLTLPAAPTH
jgi:hypothetical protein